jgi:hypothetical protein
MTRMSQFGRNPKRDTVDPKSVTPYTDIDDPKRAKLRTASELPSATKSRTDMADPKRFMPYMERDEPRWVKLCTARELPK